MNEMVDDLLLFTILALAAYLHNDPKVIREIARGLELRVPKRRRNIVIAIRKATDPKTKMLNALLAYETPEEDA